MSHREVRNSGNSRSKLKWCQLGKKDHLFWAKGFLWRESEHLHFSLLGNQSDVEMGKFQTGQIHNPLSLWKVCRNSSPSVSPENAIQKPSNLLRKDEVFVLWPCRASRSFCFEQFYSSSSRIGPRPPSWHYFFKSFWVSLWFENHEVWIKEDPIVKRKRSKNPTVSQYKGIQHLSPVILTPWLILESRRLTYCPCYTPIG